MDAFDLMAGMMENADVANKRDAIERLATSGFSLAVIVLVICALT